MERKNAGHSTTEGILPVVSICSVLKIRVSEDAKARKDRKSRTGKKGIRVQESAGNSKRTDESEC